MSLRLPARRRVSQIDVSLAIVNIVLLLIFFFVVSGQEYADMGDVNLSETSALPLERLPKPLLVIDRAGEWSLDGEPITPELLPIALQEQGGAGDLFLVLDRAAPASQLIAALNRPELEPFRLRLVTLRQGPVQ